MEESHMGALQVTQEVRARAQGALATSPISILRDLRVDCDGDSIRISGHVDTFYEKQMAQEAVLAVAKETRVVNSVAVQ